MILFSLKYVPYFLFSFVVSGCSLVCWLTGLLTCWFASLLVCKFVGLLVCWFASKLVNASLGLSAVVSGFCPEKNAEPSRSFVIAEILSLLVIFEKARLLIYCKPVRMRSLD